MAATALWHLHGHNYYSYREAQIKRIERVIRKTFHQSRARMILRLSLEGHTVGEVVDDLHVSRDEVHEVLHVGKPALEHAMGMGFHHIRDIYKEF